MKESYIENSCVKLATQAGYKSRKVKFIAQSGAPDRIFFKKNVFFWVEFKTTKGILSEIQKHQQFTLTNAGQLVYNVNNIEDFIDILKKI